ncbi:unnamed protein product [Prunus armeniaca]
MDSDLTEWADKLVRENNQKGLSLQVSPIEAYSFHVYDGSCVEVVIAHSGGSRIQKSTNSLSMWRIMQSARNSSAMVFRSVTSWDRLRRSTILSALDPSLSPHGFVSRSSRATSQWVTHPEIALAPTRLTSEFP